MADMPPIGEFAGAARNIFHLPVGGLLYPHDPTLRQRGGGRSYQIYRDALLDTRVKSAMEKRWNAPTAYPVIVDPASDRAVDQAAADLIRTAIARTPFLKLVRQLQEAIHFGFAVSELVWELVDDQWWLPVKVKKRDQRRFKFAVDGSLRFIDLASLIEGVPVPDLKFVTHAYDEQDSDPYGLGLGAILYWMAFFKRRNLTSWLAHNDRFGSPTPWATVPADYQQDQRDEVWQSLRAFARDGVIMTRDGVAIQLIQAPPGAGADTFRVMDTCLDDDINELILGSNFASKSGSLDGGGAAGADEGVRVEVAATDGAALADTLNPTWVAWICRINMPMATPPTISFDIEAEEDLGARATRDKVIYDMGLDPSLDYINRTYEGDWTQRVVAPPIGNALPGDAPDFAEASVTDPVRDLAQKAGTSPAIGAWVGQFRDLIRDSTSLDEARDKLIDLHSTMQAAEFAATMEQALVLADLSGRVDTRHA